MLRLSGVSVGLGGRSYAEVGKAKDHELILMASVKLAIGGAKSTAAMTVRYMPSGSNFFDAT
jgi:hypothetical protein